jgi:integrase
MKRLYRAFHVMEPKSRTSVRTIPIPDYAWARLQAWRARQAGERALLGDAWLDQQGLLFCTAAGLPRHPSGVRTSLRKALALAGLPVSIRFHDLRHTYATLMLEDGVHIKVVSELLGHASVNVTLMVYSHVTPRMRDRAVVAANSIFTIFRPGSATETGEQLQSPAAAQTTPPGYPPADSTDE